MKARIFWAAMALLTAPLAGLHAQDVQNELTIAPDSTLEMRTISATELLNFIDSVKQATDTTFVAVQELAVTKDRYKVITNRWFDNIYVYVDGGINTYYGDKPVGAWKDRVTPQLNIGIGKWFSPGFGIRGGFILGGSRGEKGVWTQYTNWNTKYYRDDGTVYYKEKIDWTFLHFCLTFNLTRLFKGFMGIDRNMNQFVLGLGIGNATHHNLEFGSANEWSAMGELIYKRFLTKSKALSFDVKLRALMHDTNFDLTINNQRFDKNFSLNIGLSYYFKERGWTRVAERTEVFFQDEKKKIEELKQAVERVAPPVQRDTVVVREEVANYDGMFPYLVNFVIDKVEVVNRERVNLGVIARIIKGMPGKRFTVYGYADKYTGTVKRNIWLAENRAANVFKVLTEEFGVPREQLVIKDFGGVDNMFYNDPQLSRSVIIDFFND